MDEAEIRRRYEQSVAGPEFVAEDFVLNRLPVPGTKRTLHGIEGMRANLAEVEEFFEEVSYRADRVERLDDGRWLASITLSGRGTSSGAPGEAQLIHLMRFDERDRLKRMDTHSSWERALRAAEKESW